MTWKLPRRIDERLPHLNIEGSRTREVDQVPDIDVEDRREREVISARR